MTKRVPAYEGEQPYIFVSYSHENSEDVVKIIEKLYNEKYRVWYDEGIAPGSEWPQNIAEHLKGASAVLAFVSKDSLKSPYCENEVNNSKPQKRPVYEFSLDGNVHEKLKTCQKTNNTDELISFLDKSLIGDGIEGYGSEITASDKGNFWSVIIGAAVVLLIALGIGIYGLNDGWFDSMLPGLSEIQEEETAELKEEVKIDSDILNEVIREQTNKELLEEITFESAETQESIYNIVGYYDWDNQRAVTYDDLTKNESTSLCLQNANDELLSLLPYFPYLEEIIIEGGKITSLESLCACPRLKSVTVCEKVFPFEIPENAAFTIEYMPD